MSLGIGGSLGLLWGFGSVGVLSFLGGHWMYTLYRLGL